MLETTEKHKEEVVSKNHVKSAGGAVSKMLESIENHRGGAVSKMPENAQNPEGEPSARFSKTHKINSGRH